MDTLLIDPEVQSEAEAVCTTTMSSADRTTSRQARTRDELISADTVGDAAETKPDLPLQTRLLDRAREVERVEGRVYQVSSAAGGVVGAAISLGIACCLLFAGFSSKDGVGMAWAFFIPCVVAWAFLSRIYELRMGRDSVEFISLTGTETVQVKDICEIVRYELPSGELNHLIIKLSHGSVKLETGRENIFRVLTQIKPGTRVRTEIYEESD